MTKPIISVVLLSISLMLGFIFGFMWNEVYQIQKKDLIESAVAQRLVTESLLESQSKIIRSQYALHELNKVTTLEELDVLKRKYEDTATSNKEHFIQQIEDIREKTSNPTAYSGLKESVNDIEEMIRLRMP